MNSAEIRFITPPPKPRWKWCFGGDWYAMTVRCHTSPHWLGRILQKWLLGIHWCRIDEGDET